MTGTAVSDAVNFPVEQCAPSQPKCCGSCAFRTGSPERADPWGWLALAERFEEGGVFVCHESVPGHEQEVKDGSPRMRLCRGFTATRHLGASRLVDLAIADGRRRGDP